MGKGIRQMKILFINACVREESRTLFYAREYLKKLSGDITEIELQKVNISPLDNELLKKRDKLIAEKKLDDEMLEYARQYAEADEIVIAAETGDELFSLVPPSAQHAAAGAAIIVNPAAEAEIIGKSEYVRNTVKNPA